MQVSPWFSFIFLLGSDVSALFFLDTGVSNDFYQGAENKLFFLTNGVPNDLYKCVE